MQTVEDTRRTVTCPSEVLGGPGLPQPGHCAQHALELLAAAAGPDMRLASLALDVAGLALEDATVSVTVQIDKRAQSILFASLEARSQGRLVYAAQGLFRRA